MIFRSIYTYIHIDAIHIKVFSISVPKLKTFGTLSYSQQRDPRTQIFPRSGKKAMTFGFQGLATDREKCLPYLFRGNEDGGPAAAVSAFRPTALRRFSGVAATAAGGGHRIEAGHRGFDDRRFTRNVRRQDHASVGRDEDDALDSDAQVLNARKEERIRTVSIKKGPTHS
jgi:hypothetical protein